MDKITPHASKCRTATAHDSVLNSECAYTFHSPFTTSSGIVVNLATFIGTIDSMAFGGASSEDEAVFVRIVKNRVLKKDDDDGGDEKDTKEEEKEASSSNGNGDEAMDESGLEAKVTKLGMGVDGGFQNPEDSYEVVSKFSVVVLSNNVSGKVSTVSELEFVEENKNDFPMNVTSSVESIIHHAGTAVQQDLKAWELDDEKVVSKYAESLEFVDNGVMISPNPSDWECGVTGAKENLWLNLSTGFIGGGRKNWDGSGGSNGALDHFKETGEKYPLVVKLGTITGDTETADCYSYAKDEDGPVKIPNLAELLVKRGINVGSMKKTVKSTAELEVELNATYAFDAITESGSKLVPVSGPGLQGLQNLGNSCYINSIVQMLFSGTVQELSSRYGTDSTGDLVSNPLSKVPPADAPNDMLCQSVKLASALTSGTFALPVVEGEDESNASNDPKYRLPPRMFKHIVGSDHEDFCTGQQQDAAQYLQYLMEKLDRAEAGAGGRLVNKSNESEPAPKSSSLFAYKTMSRLVCSTDNKVKYNEKQPETILNLRIPMPETSPNDSSNPPDEKRPKTDSNEEKIEEKEVPTVSLKSCLDAWSATHAIDGIRWSHLNNEVASASEENRFLNFPRYVMVQLQRYELGPDWVPRKLEVNIDMTEEIDLNNLKSLGPQDGEDILEDNGDDNAPTVTPQVSIDEGALVQLMDMGFSMNGCKRALTAVGGNNIEAAMTWIFEHNSDPDFNDPLPEESNNNANANSDGPSVDEGIVSSLVANLGCFTADQVRAALKECGGQADRAADWLFSHMDDLDGAIAALQSKNSAPSNPSTPVALEDGDGRYTLVGMVSHIGKNTGSGHYVAHLKKNGKWVIFNDEKVALSETPPLPHAYLYLFQRSDCVGKPNASF